VKALVHGQRNGLGACRSMGHGRFKVKKAGLVRKVNAWTAK
jgi:hypothetical protein